MITNLFGVLAQFEREQIGERTAFALAHKRRTRSVYGHVPFGWTRDGNRLIPLEREQVALATIRKMDTDGTSYRQIGAWLTENGYEPRQGGRAWHAASVRKMLLSRMYLESECESKQRLLVLKIGHKFNHHKTILGALSAVRSCSNFAFKLGRAEDLSELTICSTASNHSARFRSGR